MSSVPSIGKSLRPRKQQQSVLSRWYLESGFESPFNTIDAVLGPPLPLGRASDVAEVVSGATSSNKAIVADSGRVDGESETPTTPPASSAGPGLIGELDTQPANSLVSGPQQRLHIVTIPNVDIAYQDRRGTEGNLDSSWVDPMPGSHWDHQERGVLIFRAVADLFLGWLDIVVRKAAGGIADTPSAQRSEGPNSRGQANNSLSGTGGNSSHHQPGPQKRRSRVEDGSDSEGDHSRHGKRRTKPGPCKPQFNRFACPYFKRSPERHFHRQSCKSPGFASIFRLK